MGKREDRKTDGRIRNTLLRQIANFKATGRLPREHDVLSRNYQEDEPFNEFIGLDNVPQAEPFESQDAAILREVHEPFIRSLTQMEEAVYNLNMVGGMTQMETARLLNVDQPRISRLIVAIREKCRAAIDAWKREEADEKKK